MDIKEKTGASKGLLLIIAAFLLIMTALIFTLSSLFKPSLNRNISSANMADRVLARDGEIRALWIATVSNINFPSANNLSAAELKKEIEDIIKTAEDNGMNTIVFQVRPSSDALYKSGIFPSSAYIVSNQGDPFSEDLDILQFLIEGAHAKGIAVCAWVNPLRVTTSSASADKLAKTNPARLHPEYTVTYNNAIYYDPGLPEVRELISRGVAEIAENYSVDAIVFDDYFYPYPVEGSEFDDSISYIKHGSSVEISDWRRENINKLIKASYEAVAGRCYFGISPFGIWNNNNGSNGGSDTSGLSAYDSIYCDALAWIAGGYIDFISPQIYWSFDNPNAPYGELADWWDSKLSKSNIALIISHAVYKVPDWESEEEILKQIEYSRSKSSYRGSAMYGYDIIKENSNNICDVFARIY